MYACGFRLVQRPATDVEPFLFFDLSVDTHVRSNRRFLQIKVLGGSAFTDYLTRAPLPGRLFGDCKGSLLAQYVRVLS